jgi:dipeptidyl aminopeptidase/acylaminoacyl peptidase
MKKLALIFFLALTAAAERKPLTFEDLAAMKRIGTPVLSPDGRWIAYDVTSPDLEKNTRPTAVWMMRSDGTGAREVGSGTGAAWSPDGRTLAFASGNEIVLHDVVAMKSRNLPAIPGGASSLKWLPDGSGLLAQSDVYPDEASKKAATGSQARVIDSLLFRHWNAWVAPTRNHIVFVPLGGGAVRDLTPGPHDAPPFSVGGGGEFDISPDGKELVFARNTDPRPERSTNSDLYVVSMSGGEPRRITTRTGADTSPAYSPDGRWIAYRSQARAGYESDLWELWLYDRTARQARRIAADFPEWIESIEWAPDSRSIFIAAPYAGRHALFQIALDGKATLFHDIGSADGVQVAPDGKSLYFQMSTISQPADIYVLRDRRATQLTHHNDALLSRIEMGQYESTSWAGADGTRIQGWLIKPPNADLKKKYPGIVLIHGGPQGAWSEGWSYRWNPQMFAARGYVVFMPNPRGSTGFGQKFVQEISRDWAGRVYTDIMNGVDMFAALPYVDGNRIGAAGASYGGYMINWILGHTDRFKALVTHAGLYNLESMYGVTEELWFPDWEFGGPPWENEAEYRRLSPHTYVKNFKTPTLVSHGELDYRVPIGEAFQLFTALQTKGVPSRLLYFPDEGHWVLKPQNSRLWHATVLDWMDRWLK